MNKEFFDIIAIGDSAVDAFIKIREASLHCDLRHDDCQICLNYGAKIPYESATEVYATGNASNVAIGCAHLGLSTALVTCLGEDKNGDLSLQKLKTENVGTNFVSQQKEKLTNYHYVLWYEDDRTILTKHENYEYDLPEIGTPHLVYLSSLSSHSDSFHKKINDYLTAHPEVKFAFQPGSVQIKMGTEALTPLYQRADFLICNKQEAQTILKTEDDDPEAICRDLAKLGSKTIVVTDADNGAYALADGQFFNVPAQTVTQKPIERTGAGDAFASAFLTAHLFADKDTEEALTWGTINAAAVIQQIGPHAGLLSQEEIVNRLHVSRGSK